MGNLPLIRSLVMAHAGAARVDDDTVADLRLAVDEACTALITGLAPAEPAITVALESVRSEVTVSVSTPAHVAEDPLDGFARHILEALVDDVHAFRTVATSVITDGR